MLNSLKDSFEPLLIEKKFYNKKYNIEILKTQIKEIIGSYHHKFDQLYEAVQNAIDACEDAYNNYKESGSQFTYVPSISIEVDLDKNKVTIIDNGMGMEPSELKKYYFKPHATLKTIISKGKKLRQRGEKGVGATFLSYGTNYIHITTMVKDKFSSGILENGLDWCMGKVNEMSKVKPAERHQNEFENGHGTIITIEFSEQTNISDLKNDIGDTLKQWETILRLHTAVGYIDIGSKEKDGFFNFLNVNLTIKNKDKIKSKNIEKGYLYPHLLADADIQLSKLTRDSQGKLHESQKNRDILWEEFSFDQVNSFVKNRMDDKNYMWKKKKKEISEVLNKYKPEAYVCFVSGVGFWNKYNNKIWDEELENEQFNHGIVYSTKSQKIGERKRIDFKFRSGDFNRFFVLLSMKNLKADIGRKSIDDKIDYFANFFANSIQGEFVDNDDCLKPSPGRFDETKESALEDTKDKAFNRKGLSKLISEDLHFIKVPQEEQDVIALFFDLLGMGIIEGYKIYSTHIARLYDGVGMFKIEKDESIIFSEENLLGISENKFNKSNIVKSPKKCFIEFKYNSDNLVNDIRQGYKRLQDIKWLVCWEIGEKHVKEGIGIIDITKKEHINRRDYYGVTHLMTENHNKVYIICLKKVLELAK